MKKLISLILLFPLCVVAQPKMDELNKNYSEAYVDFDLTKIIKSSNDFDQTALSESEIESKISDLIKLQNDKQLQEIATPINAKKLFYLGKIHPSKTNIFYVDSNYFATKDLAIKSNLYYTYKYENLYIATKTNTLLDKYLVYYTIRSFLIIKYRFPEVNRFLFLNTQQIPTSFLSNNSNVAFINTTKNLFVTFDGNLQLPSNIPYFGPIQVGFTLPYYGIEVYPNTQVMYFNRNTILNGGAAGNIPIYTSATETSKKFHTYMKDGFIHSFIHERIHDWIFEYKNLNFLAEFIRISCQTNGIVQEYYPFEEAIVNNTTNILFEMYPNNGGLSDDILKFYRKEFDISVNTFKTNNNYQKLKNELAKYNPPTSGSIELYKKSLSYNLNDDNKLFFIDFFNIKNTPIK